MDNDACFYIDFEKRFYEKYGQLFEKYPYAMILLSAKLRNDERIKIDSLTTFKKLKGYVLYNTNASSRTKRFLYNFFSINNFRSSPRRNILVNLSSRFSYLSYSLKEICSEKNIGIMKHSLFKDFSYKLIKNLNNIIFIDSMVFGNVTRKTICNTSNDKFYKILEDNKLLKKLDLELEDNIERLSSLILKKNIRLVLSSGDQSYIKHFICSAAQKAKIPYYVILHGYPRGAKYIGVLPINADKLLVWNNEIKNRLTSILEKSLKPEDSAKIENFGYPKFDKRYVNLLKSRYQEIPQKVTFISQPFEELGFEFSRQELYNKLLQLKNKGFSVQIRLHPKEETSHEKKVLACNLGLEISGNSLIQDLLESEIILGFTSSVLYEAKLLGKRNVFHIKGFNIESVYNNVEGIFLDEIPYLDTKKNKDSYISQDEETLAFDLRENIAKILKRENLINN